MDRNKPSSGTRGPKSKITQQPPEMFIALGQKASSSRDVDSKRPVPLSKSGSSSHLQPSNSKGPQDRKREGSSSSLSVPSAKKLKTSLPGRAQGLPSGALLSSERIGLQPTAEPWEVLAAECEPQDLFDTIMSHAHAGNVDKAVSYILGAIRVLRSQRFKPCKVLSNSILLACQCMPSLFTNEHVVLALVNALRKDIGGGLKTTNKSNIFLNIMFINVLVKAFADLPNWPDIFVKMYVEDAVADRIWSDNPYCKPFVDNIITGFNTKQPPKSLLTSETWTPASRDTSSPLTVNAIDEDETLSEHKATVENWNLKIFPRYTQSQEAVEQIVLEVIKEQITRRQQPEAISKNFVRFLSTACGLVEIRVIAVSRIETWLHNHKLMKPAQELLAYLCYNCSAASQRDLEVITQLSKLRLKNKPMVNFFNNCLREMVLNAPENLYPLLKYTIYNELSNARNTNNLFVVGALFQVAPEPSADAFADICLELLLNKDDYLRSLRALLKEINRVLRHDFNLLSIVHALLKDRKEMSNAIRESEFKDRIFLSLADLVCMCMLLCVSPQVRDAATQSKRDVTVLQAFQNQVSNIQREAVTWLHDTALRVFRPSVHDFHHVLLKVVFLEQAEHYYKVDAWPGENERNLFLRLASEVPLLQATLIRILLIGISKEHPIGQNEIFEMTEQLILRAANLAQDCLPPLVMDKVEIIDFFFNLCSYNYPENISLPVGYMPPKSAISALYWKSWLLLLILAAHNPTTIGNLAWNEYPTLRMFMEMCITNHFSFPPPTMNTENEDYQLKEQQITALEKQKILEFETHLAAASTRVEITEHNSLLLRQLIELKPENDARRPPQPILDQLQTLNTSHRLGHLLCRSRNPDFLLNIMSRQGGRAHMPWLAELVHSSEGALAHLPVQCLCEYLLSTAPTEQLTKHSQLLAHLRTVVGGGDPLIACEVLEYLLRRLTSTPTVNREQATKGLTLILSPGDEVEVGAGVVENTVWLTQYLQHFPHLNTVRPLVIQFLRQAILVETNPTHVANYVNFLCSQNLDSLPDFWQLIFEFSNLIVERTTITNSIIHGDNMQTLKLLVDIFYIYLQRIRENNVETCHWIENQDYLFVTWSTGEKCTVLALIIHASIILLTYGPMDNFPSFNALLDLWFPFEHEPPKAYILPTQEETVLYPDWLTLRMIRSSLPCIVDRAVEKLEAPQLILFVQSFGLPVSSMTKLLERLDRITLMDPNLVVDSIIDKNFMISQVEVQHRRGAMYGQIFVKALDFQMPRIEECEVQVAVETKEQLPVLLQRKDVDGSEQSSRRVVDNLMVVFDGKARGDVTRSIRELTRVVCSSKEHTKTTIDNLNTLFSPDKILAAVKNNATVTSLLRILFTERNQCEKLTRLAKDLQTKITDTTTPLSLILNQYLEKCKKSLEMHVDDEVETSSVQVIRKCDNVDDARINEALMSDVGDLGEKLAKLLLGDSFEPEKAGLLVDWLSAVELEIVNLKEDNKESVQMDLLFSRKTLSFRPLLMSLVLQKASWRTLHGIVTILLDGRVSERCPTSVLDFLSSLVQSPRLWQGRDKSIPKHSHAEDVLHLNREQVIVLVNYILEEANTTEDTWSKSMEARLPLLLQNIKNYARFVVDLLLSQADDNHKASLFLLMLYISLPFIRKYMTPSKMDHFTDAAFYRTCSGGSIDVLSHTLLSALTATSKSKDWSKKSQELDVCARKLTATHPELVLRQLPMLAGSLKGRAQYDWGVLKSRGHLMLFQQVMGLLELLQPKVFQQTGVLCEIMESYFKLLQVHGHMKDLTSLVGRIVVFLQKWMSKDIKSALKYLHQYGNVLNELQIAQPCVRPLLTSVSLPTTDQTGNNELLVGTATPPTPEPLPQHWPQLVAALQSPDNLTALQDLDHITNKKPPLLEHVAQCLFNCLSSPSQAVRSLACLLIVRLLKCNPNVSGEALPVVLSCLNSKSPDVIASILERLPDVVVCMQEHAQIILTRVFQLETNSGAVPGAIAKTIALLNLQAGC